MKNQYVGDIGDYGKYGLLRFLADRGVRVGVNWYLTENDGSTDGKHTKYLSNPKDRKYDPPLFEELKKYANREFKSVKMIESAGLIPGASYFHVPLPVRGNIVKIRALNRRLWFDNSLFLLNKAELVFADPDNGISFRKQAGMKGSEKYVLPEEVVKYYERGQNVVYYCHRGRRTDEAWERAKVGIRAYLDDAQIIVMTFRRGTQRSYIFVIHPEDYARYDSLLTDFENTAWGGVFHRESVTEKNERTGQYFEKSGQIFERAGQYFEGATLTYERADSAVGEIVLESVPGEFSVCKVEDYSGIDMEEPFVFTGRTDQEKSLVCPTALVPENTLSQNDGWRAFRICGDLDFSLVGILARITKVLADSGIGVFALSTYNTDYVLTKEADYNKAVAALKAEGYRFVE